MRHYKRILAAIGSAALLISNSGAMSRTVFAQEQIATEIVRIDTGGGITSDEAGEETPAEWQDLTELQTVPISEGSALQEGNEMNGEAQQASTADTSTTAELDSAETDLNNTDQDTVDTGNDAANTNEDSGDDASVSDTIIYDASVSSDVAQPYETVELEEDTSSTFTVTWSRNHGRNTTQIEVGCILEDGTSLPEGIAPADVALDSSNSLLFNEQTIDGYEYVNAIVTLGTTTVTDATEVRAAYSNSSRSWTYSYQRASGGSVTLSGRPAITLIYRRANETAALYALKNPGDDPLLNDSSLWTGVLGVARINTDGATWEQSKDYAQGQNITKDVEKYLVSWPDGSTGNTWELTSGEYFNKVWSEISATYKQHLAANWNITDFDDNYIKRITLTPRKISRNNGGTYDKHVDCAIAIYVERPFTARFHVKEVGNTEYTLVYDSDDDTTRAYRMRLTNYTPEADKVQAFTDYRSTDGEHYRMGEVKVVDGVTYRLTGWYTENDAGAARSDTTAEFGNEGYQIPTGSKTVDGKQITTLPELDDYVVNFYAEWEVVTGSLAVSKTVDATERFYNPDDLYEVQVTLHNVDKDANDKYVVSPGVDTVVDLSIGNGASVLIEGIPSGTIYSVMEQPSSGTDKGFQVTYAYYDAEGEPVTAATSTVIEPEGTVRAVVTNSMRIVLTGVRTEETPLAAILAAIIMAFIGTTAYSRARRYMHERQYTDGQHK